MSTTVYFDFETRSTCDIRKTGADVYARHPDTEILCFAYAVNDEEPTLVKRKNTQLPIRLLPYLNDPDTKWVAHNATFDFLIWNYVARTTWGWPYIDQKFLHCTMAQCYAMSLPGSLDNATSVLDIKNKKDSKGSRVMLQLAKPRRVDGDRITWWEEKEYPDKFKTLYKYCLQDVKATRELYKTLPKLNQTERSVWELDFRINQRGVHLDEFSVHAAKRLVEMEKLRLNERMKVITKGEITSCSSYTQIMKWLNDHGLQTKGIAKPDVVTHLRRKDLSDEVRQVLLTRQEASKASTAKLEAMLQGLCPDKKMRGLFQYHGALTGRWAGRRVQLQNLPRPNLSEQEIENVFRLLKREESQNGETIFE